MKCSCPFCSQINSWRKVEFVSVAQWCALHKVSLLFHKLDNRQGNGTQRIPSLLFLKLNKKPWPSRNAHLGVLMRQSRMTWGWGDQGSVPQPAHGFGRKSLLFSCFPKYFSYMKMRNKARNEDILSSPIELCAIHSRQDKGNNF